MEAEAQRKRQAQLFTEHLLDGIVDPAALVNDFANGPVGHTEGNGPGEVGSGDDDGATLVLPPHMRHLKTDQLHVSVRSNASSAPVLEAAEDAPMEPTFAEYAAGAFASGTAAAGTAAAEDAARAADADVEAAVGADDGRSGTVTTAGAYECARVRREDGSGRFMLLPERSQPHGHRSAAYRPGGRVRRPPTPAIRAASLRSTTAAHEAVAACAPTPGDSRFTFSDDAVAAATLAAEDAAMLSTSGYRPVPPPPPTVAELMAKRRAEMAAAARRRRPGSTRGTNPRQLQRRRTPTPGHGATGTGTGTGAGTGAAAPRGFAHGGNCSSDDTGGAAATLATGAGPVQRPGVSRILHESASVVRDMPAGRAEADLLSRAAKLLHANNSVGPAAANSRPGTAASATSTAFPSAIAAGGKSRAKDPLHGSSKWGCGRGSAGGAGRRTAPTYSYNSAAEQLVATAARAVAAGANASTAPLLPRQPRSTSRTSTSSSCKPLPDTTDGPGSSAGLATVAVAEVRSSAEAKASAQARVVTEDPLDRLAAVDAALLATAFAAACGPDRTMPLASLAATLRRAGVPGVEALPPPDGTATALTGHVALRYEEVVAIAEKLRILAARQSGSCATSTAPVAATSAVSPPAASSDAAAALLPAEARVRLSRAFALECETATCQLPKGALHAALLGGGIDADAVAVRAAAADAPPLLEWHEFLAIAGRLATTHASGTVQAPGQSSAMAGEALAPWPLGTAPSAADISYNTGSGYERRPLAGPGYDGRSHAGAGYHEVVIDADDVTASDVMAAAAGEAAAGEAAAQAAQAAARAAHYGIDALSAIHGDLIIAAQELHLERKPRSRLIAHLCATTAAAIGEPAPPTRRSEAFPISDRISPINLAIVASASRALSLALEAYPAAESLLGEVSAARLQQAAQLALAHGAPAVVAVPLSDSATAAVRGELLVAVAPPIIAPPVLLGTGDAATDAASAFNIDQRPPSGLTWPPSQQRGYDYLCVDPTYDRGSTADGAGVGRGAGGAGGSRPASRRFAPADDADFTAALRVAFRSCDRDGSGSVGKRELYEALRAIGIDGTSHQMLRLFTAADQELTGQLTWQEFAALGQQFPKLIELGQRD